MLFSRFVFGYVLLLTTLSLTTFAQDEKSPAATDTVQEPKVIEISPTEFKRALWSVVFFPPRPLIRPFLNQETLIRLAKAIDVTLTDAQAAVVLKETAEAVHPLQVAQTVKYCSGNIDVICQNLGHAQRLIHLGRSSPETGATKKEMDRLAGMLEGTYKGWHAEMVQIEMVVMLNILVQKHLTDQTLEKLFTRAVDTHEFGEAARASVHPAELLMWPTTVIDGARGAAVFEKLSDKANETLSRIATKSRLYNDFLKTRGDIVMVAGEKRRTLVPRNSFIVDLEPVLRVPENYQGLPWLLTVTLHELLYKESKRTRAGSVEVSPTEQLFVVMIALEEARESATTKEEKDLLHVVYSETREHIKGIPVGGDFFEVVATVKARWGFTGLQKLIDFLQDGRITEELIAEGKDAVLKLFES